MDNETINYVFSTRIPSYTGGKTVEEKFKRFHKKFDLAINYHAEQLNNELERFIHRSTSSTIKTIWINAFELLLREEECVMFEEILSTITHPFVIVAGNSDYTLPKQIDVRLPMNHDRIINALNRILSHSYLTVMFMENLDTYNYHPKL